MENVSLDNSQNCWLLELEDVLYHQPLCLYSWIFAQWKTVHFKFIFQTLRKPILSCKYECIDTILLPDIGDESVKVGFVSHFIHIWHN